MLIFLTLGHVGAGTSRYQRQFVIVSVILLVLPLAPLQNTDVATINFRVIITMSISREMTLKICRVYLRSCDRALGLHIQYSFNS